MMYNLIQITCLVGYKVSVHAMGNRSETITFTALNEGEFDAIKLKEKVPAAVKELHPNWVIEQVTNIEIKKLPTLTLKKELRLLKTLDEVEEFVEEHRDEIKAYYNAETFTEGQWNGAIEALNKVYEMYNTREELGNGEFDAAHYEKIIRLL